MLGFKLTYVNKRDQWTRSPHQDMPKLVMNHYEMDTHAIRIKVAEDDIAFKLAILKKSLHLNDNTCFRSIIQSWKLVVGSLLAKK